MADDHPNPWREHPDGEVHEHDDRSHHVHAVPACAGSMAACAWGLLLRDAGWRHREKALMAGTPQPHES